MVVNNAFVDGLVTQLQEKEKFGLTFPKDYNYSNELMGAYLILKETQDANKKPVLESCSQASIANTLMDMVTLGVSMQKKQCYPVAYGGKLQCQALIIEAGVPFKDVKVALDFNIRKIKAVIITHEHGDHRRYWYEYVRAGIPVFEPFKNEGQTLEFDNSKFLIQAFPNQSKDGTWAHNNSDGSECPCYGFFIYHPEMGK